MPHTMPVAPGVPTPVARAISAVYQVVLWLALVLIATLFGHLHRYGGMDLLLLVCTLMVFWVVASLVVAPLTYVRTWANPFLWVLLGLVLAQFMPLPRVEGITPVRPLLGASESLLVAGVPEPGLHRAGMLPVDRYSLRPVPTAGVFMLLSAAAGMYWLVGSSLVGRKKIRRATWAVALGVVMIAFWVVLAGAASTGGESQGVFRRLGPFLVLGGDSLAPALLAGLPLVVAVVLRQLGWMPRRRFQDRQTGRGWLGRAAPVWGLIGVLLLGLIAGAIGMSDVPWRLAVACVLVSVGFVLVGFATDGPTYRSRRRGVMFAAAALVWIMAAMAIGYWAGPPHQPAAGADAELKMLTSALDGWRAAFGIGAGALSPHAIFGSAGWPSGPGENVNTNGYLLVLAETGWVGWTAVIGGALALVAFLARAWHRAESPWPRTMLRVGMGAVVANLLYFRFDASAVLAPNLLALAGVLGIVTAWAVHGAAWRRRRAGEYGWAHWPATLGATGLLLSLSTAESEMIETVEGVDFNDKLMHFGAMAVLNLLLCYALNRKPTVRLLRTRILAATAFVSLLAVGIEYAQRYLTQGRSFEVRDMAAGAAGAVAVGLWWYVVRRSHVAEPPEMSPEVFASPPV
jgi:VanZ family protein